MTSRRKDKGKRLTVLTDAEKFALYGLPDFDEGQQLEYLSLTAEELADAPSWPDIAPQLQHHIGRRPLVIFNVGFDTRILKQTAAAYNDPACWLDTLTVYCAMKLSARYYGATNRYGTISLDSAAGQAGLNWSGQAHSAVADAVMTARLVNNIAGYWLGLQCEMNDDAGSEPA